MGDSSAGVGREEGVTGPDVPDVPVAPIEAGGSFVATGAEADSSPSARRAALAPSAPARELGSTDLLLPQGASIDCTLETAIDSTLPGLATCVTPTDVFGASGRVVLLERGTQLVGQTHSDVQAGQSRLYVVWTTARTPDGVVVNLDSQGTDPLGRAGLPGKVERQWGERLGAAVMLSVIQGAIAAGIASQERSGSSSVVIDPTAPADVLTEALRQSAAVAPRIVKAQGGRIAILVERNIDFRSVYRLIHTST
ncbi:MAG: TrbI/VirB10 family protein, partial [Solirubrobacteraceae bacterium]